MPIMPLYRLTKDFFMSLPEEVVPALLGKYLIVNKQMAIITETEAYGGLNGLASHAA